MKLQLPCPRPFRCKLLARLWGLPAAVLTRGRCPFSPLAHPADSDEDPGPSRELELNQDEEDALDAVLHDSIVRLAESDDEDEEEDVDLNGFEEAFADAPMAPAAEPAEAAPKKRGRQPKAAKAQAAKATPSRKRKAAGASDDVPASKRAVKATAPPTRALSSRKAAVEVKEKTQTLAAKKTLVRTWTEAGPGLGHTLEPQLTENPCTCSRPPSRPRPTRRPPSAVARRSGRGGGRRRRGQPIRG